MEELRIYEELLRLGREGLPVALATVVETAGSSPRKAGAKMLVRGDGSVLGTIGGGRGGAEVSSAARTTIGDGLPRTVPLTLTEEHGLVCGGRLLVYVEPLAAPPRLLVFGAGHVGRALAAAAAFAGFRVTVAERDLEKNPLPEGCDEGFEIGVYPSDEAIDEYLPIAGYWPANGSKDNQGDHGKHGGH